jgi:hypothetical protein
LKDVENDYRREREREASPQPTPLLKLTGRRGELIDLAQLAAMSAFKGKAHMAIAMQNVR